MWSLTENLFISSVKWLSWRIVVQNGIRADVKDLSESKSSTGMSKSCLELERVRSTLQVESNKEDHGSSLAEAHIAERQSNHCDAAQEIPSFDAELHPSPNEGCMTSCP